MRSRGKAVKGPEDHVIMSLIEDVISNIYLIGPNIQLLIKLYHSTQKKDNPTSPGTPS